MSKPTTWMLVIATLAGIGLSACKPNADTEQPSSQRSAPSYQQPPANPSTSGTMSSPSDSEKQGGSDQGGSDQSTNR